MSTTPAMTKAEARGLSDDDLRIAVRALTQQANITQRHAAHYQRDADTARKEIKRRGEAK